MPELALPYSQTDDYLNYHDRTFIQQQMKTQAETGSRALDWAPVEEWEEWEDEQRGQGHDGYTHWNSLPELMGAHQLQPDSKGETA